MTAEPTEPIATHVSRTKGREATEGTIPGRWALSVGMPTLPCPDSWAWTPLGAVAQLESGHTPSRRQPEYWNGGVPWIAIKDAVDGHGRTITDTYQHVSRLGLANSSARLLPERTVCLSRTASVGYVVVMGTSMATSQDFVNWVCGPLLEPDYLKYILLAERDSLLRFASGTTHQTIYYPEAKAFHVLLPPVEEQRAILRVLGALDEKIELNRRMNETLEELARTVFKSWFVDFDPVRAKAEGRHPVGMDAATAALFPSSLVESALGEVPEGWRWTPLEGHVDFLAGFPFRSELFRFEPGGPKLLRGSNVAPGRAEWNNAAYWPHALDERMSRCLLSEGDIVLAMDRPWIPAGLKLLMIGPNDLPSLLVQRVARLRGTALPTSFLFTAMRRDEFTQHLLRVQTGTTVPHISARDILSFETVLPPQQVRAAFDASVAPFYGRCRQNRAESTRLTELRDLLLPRLLSGELRVPTGEKMVEAAL